MPKKDEWRKKDEATEEEEEVKGEKQVTDAEKRRVEKKDEATTDEDEDEDEEEDDDDDDEDGEEEERKQEDGDEKPMSSKPKSPPQHDAMETSSSSSSSSPFSEPEKEVKHVEKNQQDESTTDDDDDDDEDHQGTKQEDGNQKCNTPLKKPNNDKGKGKVHENNNKRSLEVVVQEEYSHSEKRSKRTQDTQFEEVVAVAQGSRKLFQRVWHENDELVILKGMIDFKSLKGISPSADFISFLDFIKKDIHFDPTQDQVKNKIRRLREKFKKNVKSKSPNFKSQHEFECSKLSSKIWGDEASKICGDEAPSTLTLTTVPSLPLLSSAEDNLTKISRLKKKRAEYQVYLKWLSDERQKTGENVDEIDRQLKGMVDLSESVTEDY